MSEPESKPPLVSVVMPVLNGSRHVGQAIDSILNQTFGDFELIVIDDGCTDNTVEVVNAIADPRIRIYSQGKNTGIAEAPNRGISLARGKYIARQDHDDISRPTRFEKQVAFLESHPDYAMVGTHSNIWDIETPTQRGHDHPVEEAILRFELLFDCQFVHSSVMMRRDAVLAVGGYDEDKKRYPPEDYDLWSRMMRRYRLANLPEVLVCYREVPNSVSRTVPFQDKLVQLCSENIAWAAGLDEPNKDTYNLAALHHRQYALVRKGISYKRMNKILMDAAHNIDARYPGSGIMKRAAQISATLKDVSRYAQLPAPIRTFLDDTRLKLGRKYPWLRSVKRFLFSPKNMPQEGAPS